MIDFIAQLDIINPAEAAQHSRRSATYLHIKGFFETGDSQREQLKEASVAA
jgi:hypothetical protein